MYLDQTIEDFIYQLHKKYGKIKKLKILENIMLDVIGRSPSITTFDCDKVVEATYKT